MIWIHRIAAGCPKARAEGRHGKDMQGVDMTRLTKICGLLPVLLVLFAAANAPAGPPDWSVNPAAYQYTGSVTSAVYRDLSDIGSDGDMLGAFVGEECRGAVAAWRTPGSNYLFLITVYSDQASGEFLSFRYYDSGMDAVCSIDEQVEFVADMIVGGVMAPMQMHVGACWPFTPSNPVPSDDAVSYPVDMLSWESGDADAGDSVVYYVYLGMNTDPPIYDTTEVYDGSLTGIDYEITPPLVVYGVYHWKIVAEDGHGMSTAGPVWTFDNTPDATEPTLWGRIKMLFE